MKAQSTKLRHRVIAAAFATIIFGVGGWASADEPTTPARQVNSTPSTPTPAAPARQTPVQPFQPVPQVPQHEPVQAQQADHRHDHDRDHRGPNIYLPWYGYVAGTDGWNGWEGWTSNTNVGNNNSTFSDTSMPNPPTAQPATMPSTPSAAETSAVITNSVDKSPEMVAANNDLHLAQVEYDKQRQRVLSQLRDKPEYNHAVRQKDTAAANLNTAKSTVTTQPGVADAAHAKLDASSDVTKMEEQAIANDNEAAAAKTHLADAVAKRDALRARMLAQQH
jgi:hypothetical protein